MNAGKDIKTNGYREKPTRSKAMKEKVGRSMHSMMDGTFLTKRSFRRAIPFIFFLVVLGILYITNIFRVERTKRQIDDLDEELKELRYEYISSRSRLMYESKPSAIALKLRETGIKETTDAPRKIMLKQESTQPGP